MTATILNLRNPDTYRESIKIAATALLAGGIAALPTETVYGLGVCVNNKTALDRLYRIKQRSGDKKLSMMIARPDEVTKYVRHISPVAQRLISSFWPGPLTIIFERDDNSTMGFRNSDNRIIRDLIDAVGIPLASTSANISGSPPAIDVSEVISIFSEKIDVILDGGPADAGSPSTIIKITGNTYTIIRQGVIEEERLKRCINEDCFSIRS